MVLLENIQSRSNIWREAEQWHAFASHWTNPANYAVFNRKDYPYKLDTKIDAPVLEFLGSEILVIKSYAVLYDRIKLGLKLGEGCEGPVDRLPLDPRRSVLITGQPGTGTLSV